MCLATRSPPPQVAFHRERGNTEVVESAWVDSLQELPQPQFTWSEAPPPAPVLPTPGKWRKVCAACRMKPNILCCWFLLLH